MSACPARSLATRSGSAIWARVISTPSHDLVADRPLGLTPIDHRSLQEDRRGRAAHALHGSADVDVEAGRFVEVGPGLLDGEDRAADDDEVVDARGDEVCGDRRRHVGRDARPRRQLVARQPQRRSTRRQLRRGLRR